MVEGPCLKSFPYWIMKTAVAIISFFNSVQMHECVFFKLAFYLSAINILTFLWVSICRNNISSSEENNDFSCWENKSLFAIMIRFAVRNYKIFVNCSFALIYSFLVPIFWLKHNTISKVQILFSQKLSCNAIIFVFQDFHKKHVSTKYDWDFIYE